MTNDKGVIWVSFACGILFHYFKENAKSSTSREENSHLL